MQTLAATVLRGDVLPERIPASGLIILRDGKPGDPEVTLSPLTWFYEHRAEMEVVIQAGTGRDALFDALTAEIGAAIATDRTLGGLCDWLNPEAPEPIDLPIEGAAALKAAVIRAVRFGIAGIGLQPGDRPLLDALQSEAEGHADFPVEGSDGFRGWRRRRGPGRGPLASRWTPEFRVSTPESTSQAPVLLMYFSSYWVASRQGGFPKKSF